MYISKYAILTLPATLLYAQVFCILSRSASFVLSSYPTLLHLSLPKYNILTLSSTHTHYMPICIVLTSHAALHICPGILSLYSTAQVTPSHLHHAQVYTVYISHVCPVQTPGTYSSFQLKQKSYVAP